MSEDIKHAPSSAPAAQQVRRTSTQRMAGPNGWAHKYTARLLVLDAILIVVVTALAHTLRFGPDPSAQLVGQPAPGYIWFSVGVVTLWMVLLSVARSREARILGHGPQEFQRVVTASWQTLAVVAIVALVTQWQISRVYLVLAIPLGTLALLGGRAISRKFIVAQRDHGELQAQVVIVGPRRTAEQMIRRLRSSRRAGYNVIGVCLPSHEEKTLANDLSDVPVLGPLEDAANEAKTVGAEYLLLSGTDELSLREARRLGWQLEGSGVGLIVLPAMVDVAGPRMRMSPVEGLPLLHVETAGYTGSKYILKSVIDRMGAAALLLFLSVPMLLIATAIRVTSKGPVLFRQTRVGRDHQPFTMYKFRSMYQDAESRRDELAGLSRMDVGNKVLFKMKDDPRVTPVGRFLRRYSLDELPQLLNAFKGDMSLVGPRPPLPVEVADWDEDVSRRQLVKPGITGLWQVSGRSDLTWEQSVQLDLYYAENWNLGGDLVIMLRTMWAVVAARGAY
ncbi:sugar transferase [uncultured Demequina sp.]|uniref:sugar transferase n=1 Tax=uncultured Demequina sp. TaxID=693499 RepID=UPI0025CED59E|nr:sugar transferase [uncultured Demequina sp.]